MMIKSKKINMPTIKQSLQKIINRQNVECQSDFFHGSANYAGEFLTVRKRSGVLYKALFGGTRKAFTYKQYRRAVSRNPEHGSLGMGYGAWPRVVHLIGPSGLLRLITLLSL